MSRADRLIGNIAETDVTLLERICESIPPPAAQVALNGEWVQEVVAKALAEGVVKKVEVVVGQDLVQQARSA